MKQPIVFLSALILSACSSASDGKLAVGAGPWAQIAKTAVSPLAGKKADTPTTPSVRGVTQEDVRVFKNPVIRVELPTLGYVGFATEIETIGDIKFYLTPEGQGLAFKNGELFSTRGYPYDLMSAESKLGDRTYRFLSGTNTIAAFVPNCQNTGSEREAIVVAEKAYNTTRTDTTCTGREHSFTNKLWIDNAGKPRKAEAWVSFQMGTALIEWLN